MTFRPGEYVYVDEDGIIVVPRPARLRADLSAMPRTVYCQYLKREAEGLDRVPYPGELGKRIYENISARKRGARGCGHQTMLINEYRLSPIEPKARKFLVEEMEKFLFGGGSASRRNTPDRGQGLRRTSTRSPP